MTVEELIEELKKQPQKNEIRIKDSVGFKQSDHLVVKIENAEFKTTITQYYFKEDD